MNRSFWIGAFVAGLPVMMSGVFGIIMIILGILYLLTNGVPEFHAVAPNLKYALDILWKAHISWMNFWISAFHSTLKIDEVMYKVMLLVWIPYLPVILGLFEGPWGSWKGFISGLIWGFLCDAIYFPLSRPLIALLTIITVFVTLILGLRPQVIEQVESEAYSIFRKKKKKKRREREWA